MTCFPMVEFIFFVQVMSLEKGSLDFENFLNLLGDRIRLKGWTGYDGELDVKS